MYLSKRTYLNRFQNEDGWNVIVTRHGKPTSIDSKKVSYIEEEFGYWRKANAIHSWFVENVQNKVDDCGEYRVGKDDFEKLADICKQIIEDPEKSEMLLPTKSGFFFGSVEYDEYYLGSIRETLGICEQALACLKNKEEGSVFIYHSSW